MNYYHPLVDNYPDYFNIIGVEKLPQYIRYDANLDIDVVTIDNKELGKG